MFENYLLQRLYYRIDRAFSFVSTVRYNVATDFVIIFIYRDNYE